MSEEPKSSDVPVSKEARPQDAQIAEPEEELPKASVANYWRVLSFGGRIEHVLLTVALITAAASGVTLPLMNIVFGSLVGNFNSYSANPEDIASEEEAFKKSNAQHALYFVYLFVGKFVLTYLGMFCFRIGGLRISAALRLSYLRALFAQPIRELDQMSTGQVATTITTAANTIQASIGDRLSSFFQSIALVIAAYAIAFKYSWALTLVVSSAILFVLVALSITVPFVLKAMQRVDKADEKHATVSSETLSSIRTVFALGAEDAMTKKHSHWVDQSHRHALKLSKWLAGQLAPFMFATYASYALAFWFGLKLYREGHISSVENVIVVFFSVLLVTTVIGQIASPLVYIGKAISSSTAFFKIIDSNKMSNSGLKAPEVSARDDIVFDNVTFAYPTRSESCVLDAFSANFKKGKTTAIVGPSGSGKSTIVALLERWYSLAEDVPYVSGSITVDSHNIEDFQLSWWRGEIGLVQQEPFLFHDTIARNVAYGLIGTQWESADETTKLQLVKEACVEAFADEFISKLPDGYDTHVGEGGIKLSGGQRQRIAIARSIVRKPSILVLDEATSAIDVRGEKIVQQALDRAAKDRTTIVIAHRLSTIRKADHIIVLRGGRKFEEGTHEELLAIPDGLYQGLVNAQTIEEEHSTHPDGEPLLEYEDAKLVRTRSEKHGQDLAACKVAEIVKSPTSNASFFRSMKRVMATQKSRWYYLPIVLIPAMVCGAANALQSWYFAQLVQTFTYTGQRLVAAANFWALMFFVLALVVMTSNVVLAYGSGRVSAHLGRHWRTSYFRSTLKMPVSYFDELENASGSVMQRLSSDPKQIQDLLGVAGAFPLISIFNIIGSVIISYAFGWKLTLVVFFTVMPVIIGASFLRMRYEVKFEEQNSKIFSESSQFATEAIGAFRTVSSLTMERVIIDKYEELLRAQIQKTTRKSSHGLLFYALTDSVELCGMALAFWYGGELLASGEYNAIQFYVVYSAIVLGAQAAGQYLSITPNLAYSKAAANRMLVVQDQVKGLTMPTADVAPQGTEVGATVTFEDVTFKYASASVPLFSRLNISIDAGQFVAFVGASGCGKTSIISLLERFYEPIRGSIKVDGVDISTVDARSYRQSLALVSQEPRLFSGTARENLVMGLDADSATPEELEQACRDAEIHEFLTSLPDGYDTELGQSTQTALSGGQKQRLCLARALLRKPHLLLLDEATSSLDSQAERLVQGAIERLAGRRRMTVIAVAHRLATIQKADVIFVFGQRDAEGQSGSSVVEKGTHAELLARRGVYWSMCQAQALDC